jgi:hypothetical protein
MMVRSFMFHFLPLNIRIAYTTAWGEGPKWQLRRNPMPRLGALTWRWPRKSA